MTYSLEIIERTFSIKTIEISRNINFHMHIQYIYIYIYTNFFMPMHTGYMICYVK